MQALVCRADQKSVFMNTFQGTTATPDSIWKESVSAPERLAQGCGFTFDALPDGQYLLSLIAGGERAGIYEFSLADRKCTSLLPGVLTFGLNFAPVSRFFMRCRRVAM